MTHDSAKPKAIDRRRFVAGMATASVASTVLSSPFIGSAQAQAAVKIGLVYAKQGVWAEHGEASVHGARIALEQAGGKALGRPVELPWLDEPNPQTAQQNAEKLIGEEKVIAVIGGTNSANGLAMSAVADRAKMPYIGSSVAAREITGERCNRYTFRTLGTSPVFAKAITPYGLEYGKNWYFIFPAYAFGTDMHKAMKSLLEAAGGKEVGADQVPLGTTDYSSYILKMRQAKPNGVAIVLVGNDLSNFCKQYNELGMSGRIPLIHPVSNDTDLWPLGKDIPAGVYGKGWHYNDPKNSAADQDFVKRYTAKVGKPPTMTSFCGWMSMRMLLSGIEAAGSTGAADIVKALEKLRVPDGATEIYYRSWDHQLIRRSVILAPRQTITDPYDAMAVRANAPENAGELEALYGTPQEIGCKMGEV